MVSVKTISRLIVIGLFTVLPLSISADTADQEIEYLLQAVGGSDCMFIRNMRVYDGADAASHLRLKYDNGKRYVSSAEDFIERLATRSSWSGDDYRIRCPGERDVTSADWLYERLSEYREVAPEEGS